MTIETSDSLERQLDVSVNSIKRSLEMAFEQYNECMKNGHVASSSFWNGYIRAMQHVLEMEHE